MNWIDNIFRRKTVTSWEFLFPEEQESIPPTNENILSHGWKVNALIHACIRRTAGSAASISMRVIDKRSGEILDNHALKQLIQHPNDFMNEFDLWYSVVSCRLLFGNAYFLKEFSAKGQLIALWPIPPNRTLPVFRANKLSHFEYRDEKGDLIRYKPEQIVWFKSFDPETGYTGQGVSPAAVALKFANLDNTITDFLNQFFSDGAFPLGVIISKLTLRKEDAQRIQEQWRDRYGSRKAWTTPAVLDSDSSYQQIGSHLKDIPFNDLDSRVETKICSIFQIPPIIVGAKIGLDRSTMANYEEARLSWWQDTLLPLYEDLLDTVQNQIMPHFLSLTPNISVEWDLERTPIFEEQNNKRRELLLKLYELGAISTDEIREEFGFEKVSESTKELKQKSATFHRKAERTIRDLMQQYLEERKKEIIQELEQTYADAT